MGYGFTVALELVKGVYDNFVQILCKILRFIANLNANNIFKDENMTILIRSTLWSKLSTWSLIQLGLKVSES